MRGKGKNTFTSPPVDPWIGLPSQGRTCAPQPNEVECTGFGKYRVRCMTVADHKEQVRVCKRKSMTVCRVVCGVVLLGGRGNCLCGYSTEPPYSIIGWIFGIDSFSSLCLARHFSSRSVLSQPTPRCD